MACSVVKKFHHKDTKNTKKKEHKENRK